ncbi:MAG TPA: hypothetical protein DCL35_01275 [Candidatus Omnitrophica bacterium]|nr:hypothetical protein [Candidatus Omnitrophota bacterium]
MADFYVYLISSLPMLYFGAKPPFAFERFLALCAGLIPEDDIELLKGLPGAVASGFSYDGRQLTLKDWFIFETTLRNELVKIRAARKKADAARYIKGEGSLEPWITHLALAAHRNPSLLEGERALDEERWRYLDGLALGHYFDLDLLIVYAQKLLILERWERVRTQDKSKLLEETMMTSSKSR